MNLLRGLCAGIVSGNISIMELCPLAPRFFPLLFTLPSLDSETSEKNLLVHVGSMQGYTLNSNLLKKLEGQNLLN